jgi:alpha-L-arabinofuranosidase
LLYLFGNVIEYSERNYQFVKNQFKNLLMKNILCCTLSSILFTGFSGYSQHEKLVLNFEKSKKVSPIVYGWHYEEIGMIGEGGLYAEMVRNRGLEEANPPGGLEIKSGKYVNVPNPDIPAKKVYAIDSLTGWELLPGDNPEIQLRCTENNPLNKQNPHSLLVEVKSVNNTDSPSGVMNTGFFGMYFKENTQYRLSLFARADNYQGIIRIMLTDNTGQEVSAPFELTNISPVWKKYTAIFTATRTIDNGTLFFEPGGVGSFQLDIVSLFPSDTWANGRSVFRADIMKNLLDYAPEFIRFPGGCLVHGVNVETMYHWKETIGDLAQRPGGWTKWSPNFRTDGLGYHEFYELCEYLGADAMYVTPSGLVCTGWVYQEGNTDDYHHPDVDVDEYIQDALDAIEYAIGPADSRWGGERAKNGHPKPFPLKYIEIGNEDFGPMYYRNYDAFYRAIHSKYPELKIIANSIIGQTPDLDRKRERITQFKDVQTVQIFDEHYYKDIPWIIENYDKFDKYERPSPDLFVGELGIRGKNPLDILGEAIFHMNLERNADLNPMMADRPLMRNWTYVEGKGNPMLFHTNSMSFKTFNYYMSKLFRDNKIDTWYKSFWEKDGSDKEISERYLFSSAGKDSKSGDIILKVVNLTDQNRVVELDSGSSQIRGNAIITILTAQEDQRNTPEQPNAIVPLVSEKKQKLSGNFTFQPRSLTIIRLNPAK